MGERHPSIESSLAAIEYLQGALAGERETHVRITEEPTGFGLELDAPGASDMTFQSGGLPFVLEARLAKRLEDMHLDFMNNEQGMGFVIEPLRLRQAREALSASMEDIPWSQLEVAHESATDVPLILEQLATHRAEERQTALSLLSTALMSCPWSDRDVAPHVVSCLLKLLDQPEVPDKHKLLQLLAELSGGSRQGLGDHAPEVGQAVRAAVLAGAEVCLKLFEDADPQIRRHVPAVFQALREEAAHFVPRLAKHLDKEEDRQTRAAILLGLGGLLTPGQDSELLVGYLEDPSPLLRSCAAIASTRVTGSETPLAVIEALEAAIRAPDEANRDYRELLGSGGESLPSAAAMSLCVNEEAVRRSVPAMLDALEAYTPQDSSYTLVGLVLSLSFTPAEIPLAPSRLRPDQREVLQRLADTPATWHFDDVMGPFMALGLPPTSEALRNWLTGSTPAAEPVPTPPVGEPDPRTDVTLLGREDLRELENRWRREDSGGQEALLLARLRSGELAKERLELAAYCDHGPARALCSGRGPDEAELGSWWSLEFMEGLERWGVEALIRAGLGFLHGIGLDPNDTLCANAVNQLEKWCLELTEPPGGSFIELNQELETVRGSRFDAGDLEGVDQIDRVWQVCVGVQALLDDQVSIRPLSKAIARVYSSRPSGRDWSGGPATAKSELISWALGSQDPVAERVAGEGSSPRS